MRITRTYKGITHGYEEQWKNDYLGHQRNKGETGGDWQENRYLRDNNSKAFDGSEPMIDQQRIVDAWSRRVDILTPRVVDGVCEEHESGAHYCTHTIYSATRGEYQCNDERALETLRHEYWHYVFDLIRQGRIDRVMEEDVIELLLSDSRGVMVPMA